MTDKLLDRPELREKMRKLLHKDLRERGIGGPLIVEGIISQILALIEPLIEERQHKLCEVCEHIVIEKAEKQERERILTLIANKGLKAFLKECEGELDAKCFPELEK